MSKGRFGIHGGQYIPETLMNAVIELEEAYNHYKDDPEFNRELTELLNEYAGRPSRLYYASHMTEDLGGAKVYLKREDWKDTCHRGDRSRPARRGDCDSGGADGNGVRSIHGRGGYETPGA